MVFNILAKIRKCDPYTFFLTCSTADFILVEIIQVLARQYGKQIFADPIRSSLGMKKLEYFKRNPVTVASQIDYTFRQLWDKVLLDR